MKKWPEDDPMVNKPQPSGPFLSFFVKKEPTIQTVLKMIREKGADYGKAPYHGLKDPKDPNAGQKTAVSLQFSSVEVEVVRLTTHRFSNFHRRMSQSHSMPAISEVPLSAVSSPTCTRLLDGKSGASTTSATGASSTVCSP